MTSQCRFFLGYFVLAFVVGLSGRAHAQETKTSDSLPPGKATVEAEISTDRIEYGMTQTDSTPSIQATLGYKWPQFKAGLWGSNFKAPGSNDNVNLRLFGAYRFIFTSNADMTARLDVSRYSQAGDANGNIISIDLNLFNWHVDFAQVENWEGSGDMMTHFGFHKDFALGSSWITGVEFGINQPSADGVSEYFDLMGSIGVKVEEMRFDLAGSVTSNSTQIDKRGKPAVFLKFSVNP